MSAIQSTASTPTVSTASSGAGAPVYSSSSGGTVSTVQASVGPVSATAVATPVAVTWTMGDGGSTTCDGPGTPYDAGVAPSEQSTSCSYTYAISSAGQSATTGTDEVDAFTVVATVDWSVTWTARGAAGGGVLPPLVTSSSVLVPVEQVESLDTLAGIFGPSAPIGGP